MKKTIIIVIVTLFLVIIGFIGWFENNKDNDNKNKSNDINDGKNVTFDSKFIGVWEVEEGSFSFIFNSNMSVYIEYIGISEYLGNWNIKDNEICVSPPGEESQCSRFEFSNNDNTVKIYFDEEGQVFNKK